MTVHYYCKLVHMLFRKRKRIGCYIRDMTYFAYTFLDMIHVIYNQITKIWCGALKTDVGSDGKQGI